MSTKIRPESEGDRWFLVDLKALRKIDEDALRLRHRLGRAAGRLSITRRLDNAQALIKVRGAAGWVIPETLRPAILRVFTPADHAEAVVLLAGPEWEPPEDKA